MSKRLQVLLPDDEYRVLAGFCRRQGKTLAEWVRKVIRENLTQTQAEDSEKQTAKILKYARYNGPTGDIEDILSQVQSARSAKL